MNKFNFIMIKSQKGHFIIQSVSGAGNEKNRFALLSLISFYSITCIVSKLYFSISYYKIFLKLSKFEQNSYGNPKQYSYK